MNRKQFEAYLNELYAEQYEIDVASQLIYLTNPERGNYISSKKLMENIRAHKAGTILRKLDPVAFTCAFNDQK